jgi:hypothetical protein
MLRRNAPVFVTVALLGLMASVAYANIPDLELSTASVATPGTVLFNRVDGNGSAFTAAYGGDATITLTLVNYLSDPLPNYPAEDLWLETSGGGLVACTDGTIADGPTDAFGHTQWQQPMAAGGCSIGETVNVMVAGQSLTQAGMQLEFVSADLTGDLLVNLADLSTFTAAYVNTYSACADMFFDGVMNLSDLSLFANSYGKVCP